MQWQHIQPNENKELYFNFPQAFPNMVFAVLMQHADVDDYTGSGTSEAYYQVYNINLSGYYVFGHTRLGYKDRYILAIGFSINSHKGFSRKRGGKHE